MSGGVELVHWIRTLLAAHPEITFFVILGTGYLVGKIALGSFKLGGVTGTLIAGVLIGQLGLTLPVEVRQVFFLLFLFASGFRTGPQVFLSLKKDGLQQGALTVIVGTVGLIAAYIVARIFHYDPGTGAGMLAGSLTESAAIGTAMDAIARLPEPEMTRAAMANNVPVAYAVTYLVGVTGAAWFLSQLAPRIMRVNLVDECRKLERQLQVDRVQQLSGRRDYELRAFATDPGSPWADRNVVDLETAVGGARVFVERVRRGGELIDPVPALLQAGDVVAISGPRATLVEMFEATNSGLREVDDTELLSVPVDLVDVVVTNPAVDGRTLADLGREEATRGVFLKRLTRGGMPMEYLWETPVRRGDVLTVVGSAARTARAVEYLGVADRATDATNMLVVATAIVAGALIGLPALHIGGIEVGFGLPVGVMLGGIVCGWLRSVRPHWFGRLPGAALLVFESIGLTGFVGVVGLNAGPAFVKGVQMSGPSLVLAGLFTVSAALLVGVVLGRWVFRMHPGVLLGVCAGACTATPALAAVQEAARSAVPTMGFAVAYAIGNVVLTIWGTVMVMLLT
jgi:putative transport protein